MAGSNQRGQALIGSDVEEQGAIIGTP